ncbi:hypothetical protein LIER_00801 [Lithospermum erythrorhizon]|uniref:FAF domain-containing protein n=1 Tax=Lithospermum erythrorhizon TaxID=34254 RepID=A0AAV3NJ68_LITER
MAACESLQHILPENPTLFEPFSSWSSIKAMEPIDSSSFTELFGELHFKENQSNTHPFSSDSPLFCVSSPSSSSFSESNNNHQLTGIERLFRENNECNNAPFSPTCYYPKKQYMHGHSFSSISSEGLSHCTESLGSESSDEVEEFGNDHISRHRREEKQGANVIQEQSEYMYCDHKRLRVNRGSFPPPISCIGGNGRPFVSFKSYRENGRFILKEVRIPQQQFLRASRENGRLKLQLIHADDEIFEEYDEEEIVDDEDFIKEVDEDDSINEEEEEFRESNVDNEEQDPINNKIEHR